MAEAPRVGIGFDVHRWSDAGDLWLGGVRFDGEPALEAHSDGDVVCHALADALLGAAALGDVGAHFPDDDPDIAGIAGTELLSRVVALLEEVGGDPSSCDVTVVCDRPRIGPARDVMRERLATVLGVPTERVSVKATRPEGLGLVGDGVGCLAVAVVS
jgi:2-C-methyl-D-erythritol 4-phosphate cytidylyltransferase/2-C-methyl-D-erythritol 2,4-cyclodiphosphate synthase